MSGKVLIFSAPSGSGKSTVVNHILGLHPEIEFSVSATSRAPRGTEQDGVEYYFLTPEDFKARLDRGEFLEHCEVYPGRYYGTLRSEVDSRLERGENVVLDLDVIGAMAIKEAYGDRALSLYIQPPSIDVLRQRLEGRGTDTPDVIDQRIARAEFELSFAPKFDAVVVNDDLEQAKAEALKVVKEFLGKQTP